MRAGDESDEEITHDRRQMEAAEERDRCHRNAKQGENFMHGL